MKRIFPLTTSLLISAAALAVSPDELLPPALAFPLSASLSSADLVDVELGVEPGYALYRAKIDITPDNPEAVSIAGIDMPAGITHRDPVLGDIAEFREPVTIQVRIARRSDEPPVLRVKVQGCADIGVCFNPLVRRVTAN